MDYDLTEEAADDIRNIIRYTLSTWGRAQVERYRQAFNACLERLVSGQVVPTLALGTLPDVYRFRCQHHFIFYTLQGTERPLIIAVLHERQDFLAHLSWRDK